MKLHNPTAKRTLKTATRLHQRVTRNNTPGIVPIPPVVPTMPQPAVVQRYQWFRQGHVHVLSRDMPSMHSPNPSSKNARTYLRHTFCPKPHLQGRQFDQSILHAPWYIPSPARQFLVTKNWWTIQQRLKLCKLHLGRTLGACCKGITKGQKGMNAMFVMMHDKIRHVLTTGQKFTYGNPVINYRPQK